MKVFIVMRAEEHSDYVEKVFFNKEHAEQYAAQFVNNPNEYARHVEKHKIEDIKIIQNSMTDKNCPQISTTQQPLNIPSNISGVTSLIFLGMLFMSIPCMDILGKFDSDTQIKMLGNSLSDNELKELAESKEETYESVKNAVKECKYLFNIKENDTDKNQCRRA